MKTVLDILDDFLELHEGNAMISRRVDLSAPNEWSAILTCVVAEHAVQFAGYAMSPARAIERALAKGGVIPCPTCEWAGTCPECRELRVGSRVSTPTTSQEVRAS